jgi:membrane-bound lytic murein transglycosylase D
VLLYNACLIFSAMFSSDKLGVFCAVMLFVSTHVNGQSHEVFRRLQSAEEFWYQYTGLRGGNALDTCPGYADLYGHLKSQVTRQPAYDRLIEDYAGFFSRHRCEGLSLYEEIARYYASAFAADHYADYLKERLYLAVFLTGLHPAYQGDFDRKGIWRLTFPVAIKYGLRVDEWVDERFSPRMATKAFWWYAFDMQRLYEDVDLATLALVTSPAQVEKFIQQSMQESQSGVLPIEARQVLFELDLLKALFQPDWFQIKNNRITTFHKSLDAIQPGGLVRFDVLAKFTGLDVQKIKSLNPVFIAGVYPEDYQSEPLYLTQGASAQFKRYQKQILEESKSPAKTPAVVDPVATQQQEQPIQPPSTELQKHQIKSGETLQSIAQKYQVSLTDLMRWNQLRNDRIMAGQTLVLYLPILERPKEATATATAETPIPPKFQSGDVNHTVQSGETLWKISQRFPGVSPEDIIRWNNLKGPGIREGQKLIIKPAQR